MLNSQISRKRKRLQVSFCTLPEEIIDTYSASDYDRSGRFPDSSTPPPYFFALKIKINIPQEYPIVNPSSSSSSSSMKRRPPKLTIDTSHLNGPLYFTKMTTNHPKKSCEEEVDSLTKENTRRNSLRSTILS